MDIEKKKIIKNGERIMEKQQILEIIEKTLGCEKEIGKAIIGQKDIINLNLAWFFGCIIV